MVLFFSSGMSPSVKKGKAMARLKSLGSSSDLGIRSLRNHIPTGIAIAMIIIPKETMAKEFTRFPLFFLPLVFPKFRTFENNFLSSELALHENPFQ